jgi:hypothetical protein
MWRFALCIFVASCGFDADYTGGHFKCSDGTCPTTFECRNDVCFDPNAPIDAAVDAGQFAHTCDDPEPLGSSKAGTTVGQANTVSSSCAGVVENGADAVYTVGVLADSVLDVTLADDFNGVVYVLGTCTPAPATPTCDTNMVGRQGTLLRVPIQNSGNLFLIVDSQNAADTGTFTVSATLTQSLE